MSDPLVETLDALARYVLGGATLAETLNEVARMTVRAIDPAEMVGITLLADGKVTTAVFTDPVAPDVDRSQYETGEGPCLLSFQTGETVRVPSTNRDRRFRAFSRACLEHGILSTLSMPLVVADETLGALNLYARRSDAFTTDDEAVTSRFAVQAAVVLANAQTHRRSVALNEQLGTAIVSREVIDLARGIIVGATGCSPEEAFNRLVEESQHTNIKLREVAAGIVDRALKRPPAPRS